ncbi:beta-glucanase (GH16 family) [Flavobacterium sp. 103]|uniref:glycoside hydrolase family 16 protein n=1 Tax=unclassified Flavobacterium TaxID=196869 RepID=UPI000D5FC425|nr:MULTISPECIES: glycoside hydrolase family 16 protein [unclassified Flavobacterium]PVX46399.1 beta-glucanase (GH16 family) [Flavobacterium sp. 103]QKJ65009.1 glycoside hydrolase family 16 protein [Flavobacterium sp. M31R6]
MRNNIWFTDLKSKNYLLSLGLLFTGLSVFLMLLSCSDSNGGGEDVSKAKPSDLSVTATVVGTDAQNPNGDGSGVVNFKLSATNATSYKIVLGNGETKEVTNGSFSYTYTTSGSNTYVLYVSAYNAGQFVSKTLSITVFVGSKLVWSDEFNTDGAPDATKWTFQIWDPGNVNNELQSYTNRPENTIVQGGLLKIKAIREKYGKGDFTSGRLESNGKFDFTYGKVVIRAKLPTGVGTWPAVWMLGSNIGSVGWPACGEIDILESVGKELNVNHSSLHSPGRSGNTPDTGTINVPNDNTEFHIYTADWTASYIKFYVDDKLFYTFVNSDKFPFNKNFYLIVNLAMGGNWGGPVDPNFTSSTLEVDYIRVYN